MLESIISAIRPIIPEKIFRALQPMYHFSLSLIGAVIYKFPSKKLVVIGVTGTKGKSTTSEIINSIFEEAGYKTVLANTIRFKIADKDQPNMFKMTMPGRFFIQKFLNDALKNNCSHAILEISSEAVLQYREKFLYLDALVFTNLAKEHIESHGSYENYVKAKLKIGARVLENDKKRQILILNSKDSEAHRFEQLGIKEIYNCSIDEISDFKKDESGISFLYKGEKIMSPLIGDFNAENILLAIETGIAFGITIETAKRAIKNLKKIPGRVEQINEGQNFTLIVDYAHTPESLEGLYKSFDGKRKICVLSGTGGGRDKWKRPKMGEIADKYCDEIILTDEDPYDEDPKNIIEDIKKGIYRKKPTVIIDRREAIGEALKRAKQNDAVLITGKGTDPFIMGPNGKKTPWSDVLVAKEELKKIFKRKT